jgi:transposase
MEDIDRAFSLKGLRSTEMVEGTDEKGNEALFIHCVPVSKVMCTVCGSMYVYVDRHTVRTVQDLDSAGKKVFLVIHITRYICRESIRGKPGEICGKTFQPPIEMIDEKARLTKRFRDEIAGRALREPFLRVAQDYGISDMTVKRALESYIEEKEKWRLENFYCPIGIGIDENHLNSRYCLMITDNDQHTLLDMFDNKDPSTVRSVLMALKEKENLQYVTMDLSSEYRAAVEEVFGQKAAIIADRFHVQKLINNAMMDTRTNLVSKLDVKVRSGTKYNANLLRINIENLTDKDKERMSRMFKAVPMLDKAYGLKEAFRSIYMCKDRVSAEKAFKRFCREIPGDEAFEPFRKTCRTIRTWHEQVFNYFDYDGASNGFTEAENGIVSRRNMQGNGYSFKTLRGLALYGKGSTGFHPNRQAEKNRTARKIISKGNKKKI